MDEQEIRALDADAVLKNPLFNDAFNKMRENLVQQIELCPWNDDQYRDKLMLSLQLLRNFKRQFEQVIQTGQLGAWLQQQREPE